MATTVERPGSTAGRDPAVAARTVNLIIGIWLFISAFLWPHTPASRTNTWIVGLLCVVFALIAMRSPQVRWLNTLLAVWLFISTLSIYRVSGATLWNNLIAAIVIFFVSLVPSREVSGVGRPPRYA